MVSQADTIFGVIARWPSSTAATAAADEATSDSALASRCDAQACCHAAQSAEGVVDSTANSVTSARPAGSAPAPQDACVPR